MDSIATIRRKVERRALPAEPPTHLKAEWEAVARMAMQGAPAWKVRRAAQIMRQREKDYLKGTNR